jgi:nickel-dependent lactate racemase
MSNFYTIEMNIELAYGKKGLGIQIPDQFQTEVVETNYIKGLAHPYQSTREALINPIQHPSLKKSVRSHQKVAIIFNDITRATPYHILVPALLDSLNHLPDKNITFFCATGTHRPATHQELCAILGKKIVERFRIVQNDATQSGEFQYVGTTASGNRILLNKELLEYDLRILTGFIEPHFFAGFSGGGKALMPGMAYVDSIRYNHSIKNLETPKTGWGQTYGNPLWEDIMEAAEFANPLFLLNISMNRDKEITGVFAGDLRAAHKKGCVFVKKAAMAGIDHPFDIVITSNSGYPLDLNLYQSVKGMSAAAQIVKKGGTIIIAAECWDGIPAGSDFETILRSVSGAEKMMDYIKQHETDLKDTWQVFFLAMILKNSDVYLYSTLEDQKVEKVFLKPVSNISKLVLDLMKAYGTDSRICVLPEGPLTIPYLK